MGKVGNEVDVVDEEIEVDIGRVGTSRHSLEKVGTQKKQAQLGTF